MKFKEYNQIKTQTAISFALHAWSQVQSGEEFGGVDQEKYDMVTVLMKGMQKKHLKEFFPFNFEEEEENPITKPGLEIHNGVAMHKNEKGDLVPFEVDTYTKPNSDICEENLSPYCKNCKHKNSICKTCDTCYQFCNFEKLEEE